MAYTQKGVKGVNILLLGLKKCEPFDFSAIFLGKMKFFPEKLIFLLLRGERTFSLWGIGVGQLGLASC